MKSYGPIPVATVADVIEFGRHFREIVKSKSLDEVRQWAKENYTEEQMFLIIFRASLGATFEKTLTDKEYKKFKDYIGWDFVDNERDITDSDYVDIHRRVSDNLVYPPFSSPDALEEIWSSLQSDLQSEQEIILSTLSEVGGESHMTWAKMMEGVRNTFYRDGHKEGEAPPKPHKKPKSGKKKSEEPGFDR